MKTSDRKPVPPPAGKDSAWLGAKKKAVAEVAKWASKGVGKSLRLKHQPAKKAPSSVQEMETCSECGMPESECDCADCGAGKESMMPSRLSKLTFNK